MLTFFAGDKSTLAEISEIDIPPSALKLEELTQRTEQTIDISSYLPSGVSLAEENANKVVICSVAHLAHKPSSMERIT